MMSRSRSLLAGLLGLFLACAASLAATLLPAAELPPASVPMFDGLGKHGRAVTTSSPEAQRYFNQGLCFLYAFNHDEAIRSFKEAGRLDPQCAMAWWGIAIASGPNINNPMVTPEQATVAWEALTKARATMAGAMPMEQALINALGKRYANPQPEDRKPLDEAYAAAMRVLWKNNPTDADVGAMFAESMMDLRPWDLWTPQGVSQPGTDEVVATLEATLTQQPDHPLALHLYMHALEASPHPEKAIAPADRLRTLQPGLGHMVHMPSHIDVRTGRWAMAIESNRMAMEADRRYREISPKQGFYRMYMAHNHHMLSFAAMMRGQSQLAISAINEMVGTMPADWVKENPAVADGFMAMPVEVLVRFGRWDEVLAAPELPEYLPIARALRRCARGIAYAAKGDLDKAREEEQAFLAAVKMVPEGARMGNNSAADVLSVAKYLLAGEIMVRTEQSDMGITLLHMAVKCEDQLRYSEPPDWIHPVRHALGATLLTLGKDEEAEKVYREDLTKLPNNGWALYGLFRSLKHQGKMDDAKQYEVRFQDIFRDADVKITSSCFCQPGK